MRAKSMVLIVIALGCGLVASIGISQVMDRGGGTDTPDTETMDIYVAGFNLNIGEELTAENVKLEGYPVDIVPEGSLTSLEDLEGQRPRERLRAGMPILEDMLMGFDESSAAEGVPEGFRAQAVKVDAESAVGELVEPGDRVDVMVYLRKSCDVGETSTRTILQNVTVFAVGKEITREKDDSGHVKSAKTVSLLITPEHGEKLFLASRLGEIRLQLRGPDDETDSPSDGASVPDILGLSEDATIGRTAPATVAVAPTEKKPSLYDFLRSSAAAKAQMETAQPVEKGWMMDIVEPTGARRFEFDEANAMFREVTPGGATHPVQPPAADVETVEEPPADEPEEEEEDEAEQADD